MNHPHIGDSFFATRLLYNRKPSRILLYSQVSNSCSTFLRLYSYFANGQVSDKLCSASSISQPEPDGSPGNPSADLRRRRAIRHMHGLPALPRPACGFGRKSQSDARRVHGASQKIFPERPRGLQKLQEHGHGRLLFFRQNHRTAEKLFLAGQRMQNARRTDEIEKIGGNRKIFRRTNGYRRIGIQCRQEPQKSGALPYGIIRQSRHLCA